MSRHCKIYNEEEFAIGWDNPMQTYFASNMEYYQDYNERVEDMGFSQDELEDMTPIMKPFWIGQSMRECFTLSDFINDLHATTGIILDDDFQGVLYLDRDLGR